MKTFLTWVSSKLPCRVISDSDQPYLERYYLFTVLGWRFYLHKFVGSDPDRGLHDHPWAKAYSIILSGWYWEETRSGVRKIRWLNSLTGDTFHRVVLPYLEESPCLEEYPCWTLFFHTAGDVKDWGFWRKLEDNEEFDNYIGNPSIKGAALFTPYKYPEGFVKSEWWKKAKPRRSNKIIDHHRV